MKSLGPVLGVVVVAGAAAAGLAVYLAGPSPEISIDDPPATVEPPPMPAVVVPPSSGPLPTPPIGDRPVGPNPVTPTAPAPTAPTNGGPRQPGGARAAKRNTARQPTVREVGQEIDALERSFRAHDPNAVTQMLERLLARGAAAVPDIIDALERAATTDRGFRKQLVQLLEKLDDPRGAVALQALALDSADSDMEMRKMAAISLGKMDPAHGVPALQAIIAAGGDPLVIGPVRTQAVTALAEAGGDVAKDALLQLVQGESDRRVRAQAVSELRRFPSPETTTMLAELARSDGDITTRTFAIQALSQSTDERATPELAGLLERWPEQRDREALYLALQQQKKPATADTLRRALEQETNTIMIKRAAGTLCVVLGADARDDLQRLHDRYENHPELYPFFRNLLKQFEQQTATHGTDGPAPPPPAGQPR